MSGIHVPLPHMEHNPDQGPGLGLDPCQGQGADPVPDQGREAVAGLLLLWVCFSVVFQNFVMTPLYNDEVWKLWLVKWMSLFWSLNLGLILQDYWSCKPWKYALCDWTFYKGHTERPWRAFLQGGKGKFSTLAWHSSNLECFCGNSEYFHIISLLISFYHCSDICCSHLCCSSINELCFE